MLTAPPVLRFEDAHGNVISCDTDKIPPFPPEAHVMVSQFPTTLRETYLGLATGYPLASRDYDRANTSCSYCHQVRRERPKTLARLIVWGLT